MRTCAICGATVGGDEAVCPADGGRLVTIGEARTLPVRRSSDDWCVECGARLPQGSADFCPDCGHRVGGDRSTFPGAIVTSVGDLVIVRSRGEGDVLVLDPANQTRLLVFGREADVSSEARALSGVSRVFPSVLTKGQMAEVGHFVVLTIDIEGASPLGEEELSLPAALAVIRSALEAAAELEARGFTWEPAADDFYLRPGGELVAVRARGARTRIEGQSLNAKRVLEALGERLVPTPATHGTPELMRLLLPRQNFSTLPACTIAAAREALARVQGVVASRSASLIAELCDPGLRRNHNEDATAVAEGDDRGDPFSILVVCDGVSSSSMAGRASTVAAKTARDTLAELVRGGGVTANSASLAVSESIRAAHIAVCTTVTDYGLGAPPGTTIVVALVYRQSLTVGWVGDSRAYWVSAGGSDLCTTDHSWVNEAIARGEATEAEAMQSPFAHALTRCLGPLEVAAGVIREVESDVRTRPLSGPGHVVLCTDGLWNYFPSAEAIAGLVAGAGEGADPEAVARYLVCQALGEGGGDNVSVVVQAVP